MKITNIGGIKGFTETDDFEYFRKSLGLQGRFMVSSYRPLKELSNFLQISSWSLENRLGKLLRLKGFTSKIIITQFKCKNHYSLNKNSEKELKQKSYRSYPIFKKTNQHKTTEDFHGVNHPTELI